MGILDAGYRLLDPILPFDKYLDPRFGGGSGGAPMPAPQMPAAPVRSGIYGPQMGGEPPMAPRPVPQPAQMAAPSVMTAGPRSSEAPSRRKPTLTDTIWGVLAGQSPGMARLRAEEAYATADARDMARRQAAEEDAMARRVFGADEAGYLAWRGNREETGRALASRQEDYTLNAGGIRGRGGSALLRAPTAPLKLSPGERAYDERGREIAAAPFRPEIVTNTPGSVTSVVDLGQPAPSGAASPRSPEVGKFIYNQLQGLPGVRLGNPGPRSEAEIAALPLSAKDTYHRQGAALDFTAPGQDPKAVIAAAKARVGPGYEVIYHPENGSFHVEPGPDWRGAGPAGTPTSRVVARGEAKPMARPATAAEKAAYGLSADTPATMSPDGEIKVLTAAAKDLAADEKAARAREMQAAKAQSIIATIDGVLPAIGKTTAGLGGQWLGNVPGTPAYDVGRQIDTIKANLGFQELQAMRESSPTGGALGAIAVQELIALQATVASLDQGQSPKQLEANLKKIRTHYNRWLQAVNGDAAPVASPKRPAQRDPFPGIKEGQRVTQNGVTYRRQGNQMVPVR